MSDSTPPPACGADCPVVALYLAAREGTTFAWAVARGADPAATFADAWAACAHPFEMHFLQASAGDPAFLTAHGRWEAACTVVDDARCPLARHPGGTAQACGPCAAALRGSDPGPPLARLLGRGHRRDVP